MRMLEKLVDVRTSHTGLAVRPEGLLCRNAEGQEELIRGETVICAVGQRSRKHDALLDAAPFVRVIGDAVRPSTIGTAVYQAGTPDWMYNTVLRNNTLRILPVGNPFPAGSRNGQLP